MKQSEKSIILGGIVLLILAAFFTISIMVQFLNFGITKEILVFFKIGQILFSAYGYSSILIPIFLFVASISFFSVNFSKKRAVILAASLLPFFTVVATERICNKILPGSTEPVFALKLITAFCICGLLIVIEYLATGIAYDAIISIKKSEKKKKNQISTISTSPSDLEVTQLDEANSDNKFFVEAEDDELNEDDAESAQDEDAIVESQKEDICDENNESVYQEDFETNESVDEILENETENEDFVNEVVAETQVESEVEDKLDVKDEVFDENVTESQKVEDEETVNVIFSRNQQDSYQNDAENDSDEVYAEDDKSDVVCDEAESQEITSSLINELYQPNSAEEDFLENPFGEEEVENEVYDEVENEIETADENELKYDYNLEPEIETEFMSEEERMNTVVPLMDIQLGDDEEENEEIQEEVYCEEDEHKEKNNDDFVDIDFDNNYDDIPNIEEKSSVPKDPLFQTAHEETVFEQVDFDSDSDDFNENSQYEDEVDDIEEDSNQDDDLDEDTYDEYDDEDEIEQEVSVKVQTPVIQSVPKRQKNAPYRVPSEGLLTSYPDGAYWIVDSDTQKAAVVLKETLSEFKIEAEVTGIRKGPVITMFEILPAPGVKLNKIVSLQDNIALRLAASSIRIVAPIPGKSAVGIEVPNKERAIVSFKELIETETAAYKKMAIPVVLGKDITGEAQLLDLAKTPHLLIAGSTGSGKSVCVNSMILSILYKRSPNDVKLILIDPKVVELKLYNDIPHLLTPVITEPKKAFQALQYCLCEMERRYALLDGMGVRDITSFNHRIEERNIATEKLPYIVVVIDEFADLMATTGKELESVVARLAAMSRAVGIHLVLATQRPSIDVITGLIKANIPTRIAFMVASKMDSRIIIDQVGAEKLLGRGDMLYASATDPFPVRIQGTYVSDNEVENVVDYVKQYGEPEYIDDEIFVEDDDEVDVGPNLFGEGEDPLYNKALEIVIQAGKASASYIQRRLKIGYNRAARLVEEMEARGIVGPANGSKPREIIHIP